MKGKECMHTRTRKDNMEVSTGSWSTKGENRGEISMMTNVREIAEKVQKFGRRYSRRDVDVFNGTDSHEE